MKVRCLIPLIILILFNTPLLAMLGPTISAQEQAYREKTAQRLSERGSVAILFHDLNREYPLHTLRLLEKTKKVIRIPPILYEKEFIAEFPDGYRIELASEKCFYVAPSDYNVWFYRYQVVFKDTAGVIVWKGQGSSTREREALVVCAIAEYLQHLAKVQKWNQQGDCRIAR